METEMAYRDERYFTVTVTKQKILEPEIQWTNVYELIDTTPGTEISDSVFNTTLEFIRDFEQELMFQDVYITAIRLKSLYPDDPDDPEDTYTFTSGLPVAGDIIASADFLPMSACVHISKTVPYGRQGKLYLRHELLETDVQANSGESWAFSSGKLAAWQSAVDTAIVASGLDNLLFGGGNRLSLALIRKTDSGSVYWRILTGMIVKGVVWNKFRKRWYNKQAPGPIA